MLAAVLPSYDFGGMKPWHLKGTYQLYDETGRRTEQGTYEYWHESAKVYRSSWTRPGATRSEWHTADGKAVYKATGDRLFYSEHNLERFLFSPVPDPAKLDPATVELSRNDLKTGKVKLPCANIKPHVEPKGGARFLVPEGSYCFDPSQPLLRVIELFGSVYVEFNKLGKMQNRILSRQITVSDGHSRLLTFDLVATDGLPNNAAELIPPSDSTPYSSEDVSSLWTHGGLVKKEHPSYPAAAKAARISGLVLLDVMIGKDGHVRDIRVLDTPSPVLTEASERAVEQWQYDPAMVEGRPQELNTMINVIYSLSY